MIVNNQESTLCQMDPLSSPYELSPLHVEGAPIMWLTSADMKFFLRPAGKSDALLKRAIALRCCTMHILRECCELTDFRQTSFGNTS